MGAAFWRGQLSSVPVVSIYVRSRRADGDPRDCFLLTRAWDVEKAGYDGAISRLRILGEVKKHGAATGGVVRYCEAVTLIRRCGLDNKIVSL